MSNNYKTRLQTLFWEIKNRFFYFCFSFVMCLFVTYQYSESLLYLLVLSSAEKENIFQKIENTLLFSRKALSLQVNPSTERAKPQDVKEFFILIFSKIKNKIYHYLAEQTNSFGYGKIVYEKPYHPDDSVSETNSFSWVVEKLFLKDNSRIPDCLEFVQIYDKWILCESCLGQAKTNLACQINLDLQNQVSTFSLLLKKIDKEELNNLCSILELSNNYIIKFKVTNVEEAFSSTLVICFVFSFLAIFPYFIYAFISFLAPILFLHDRKKFLFYFINFFVLSLLFNIALQNKIIPIFAEFFVNFRINDSGFQVLAETKIYCYCIWAINIFIKANLLFSVFCFFTCLIFNNKIEIRESRVAQRKTCFLIILIVSALLAPPDLIYQSFLAFLLTICFEALIYLFFVYTALTNP